MPISVTRIAQRTSCSSARDERSAVRRPQRIAANTVADALLAFAFLIEVMGAMASVRLP